MTVQTNNEKQAAASSWLDEIVEPTALSKRVIPRAGETVIPLNEKQAQLQRVLVFVRLVEEGKLASAAHVRREWKKHNPYINGTEDALQAAQRETLHGKDV